MVKGTAHACQACGQPNAPARCAICQAAWFCGPSCQRAAWVVHRLECQPPAVQPLRLLASASEGGSEARIAEFCQRQKPLDALAEALRWQLTDSSGAASRAAEAIWQRQGFEPVPRDRHDYSLLHAKPPASMPKPSEPMAMREFRPEVDGDCSPGRRWASALVGAKCPVIDARGSTTSALQKLQPFFDVKRAHPCIIRNLPIFDTALRKWDVGYLAEHLGEQLYHTFAAPEDTRLFGYFFEVRNEGGYEAAPIAEACKMTFTDFMDSQQAKKDGKAYYLQTPVLQHEANGVVKCAKFDDQMVEDLHGINNNLVKQLSDLGSFGQLSRNQLFVSFADFLTATHYDQQHNLFLQVRGKKRFLLFDPGSTAALHPFPVHHPLDRKVKFDAERLDAHLPQTQALIGRGVEALLEPGDVLFMPMTWFHMVHSLGPESVSLNWWFYDSGALFSPAQVHWPLASASLVELSRHAEYFIAEQLGPVVVGAFFEWWLGNGPAPGDMLLANRWRLMRNYILRQLAALPRPAGSQVLAMLDPQRWSSLSRRPGLPSAAEGLRADHQVSELLQGLDEVAGLFRCSMPGSVYRLLGRCVDVVPRAKLRMFLECADEVLILLREGTAWEDGMTGKLFTAEEAKRTPSAIFASLEQICDVANAPQVRVAIVDNGFFANWLQVVDARLFAAEAACVEPNWILTGQEREFNYGDPGDDVFRALFDPPVLNPKAPQAPIVPESPTYDVHRRYNLQLVNVFRGYFLRGTHAASRRRLYAEAAHSVLRPGREALRLRDEAMACVARGPESVLIGVHKRVDNPGTARMQFEQEMACTEAYILAVQILESRRGKPGTATIVLATDDEHAVGAFQDAFGARLVYRPSAKRCAGGVDARTKMPIEVHGQNERLTIADARDCLVDALLLAECDAFVHADSNVTLAAGIMNPQAEAVHVRNLVPEAKSGGEWKGYRRLKLPV